MDCDPGYYLPLNSSTCSECEPGSYSLGGGERFYHWQDNFPKSPYAVFNTYCSESDSVEPSDNYPLCGWTLNGFYTDSGNLTDLESVNSVLEVSFAVGRKTRINYNDND